MKLKSLIYSAILLLSVNCFAQPQLATERVALNALNRYPVDAQFLQVGTLPNGAQLCQLEIRRFNEYSPDRVAFGITITPPLSSVYQSTHAQMFITLGRMGGNLRIERDKEGDFVYSGVKIAEEQYSFDTKSVITFRFSPQGFVQHLRIENFRKTLFGWKKTEDAACLNMRVFQQQIVK